MKSIGIVALFLFLNFSALGIGAWLMGGETQGSWYSGLNKAPWTPPGWVFGAAWFSIMVLFSIYMWQMHFTLANDEKPLFYAIFALQWVLNVMWNPLFFRWHWVLVGLVVIVLLWLIVIYMMIKGFKTTQFGGWAVLPYAIWLGIATSLNAYIVINN
jgi:translocator protein